MKKGVIISVLFILLISLLLVRFIESGYVGEVVSSKKVENIDDSEPIQKFNILGLGSISFGVSSSKVLTTEGVKKTSLNTSVENVYEFSNLKVETVYEEVDTGFFNVDEKPIKQSFRLTNLLDEDVDIVFDVKYEINADKVMWNGTEYEITETPKFFKAFEVEIPELGEPLLIGHTLYFNNNYFGFKDVTDLDYSVSVYSEEGRNYITLSLNLKFDSLETIVIDPEIGWSSHIIENFVGGAEGIFAIDINRDNYVDVISVSGTGNRVAWYKNDGSPTPSWVKYIVSESISYGRDGFAADVDSDGYVDVLSASSWDDKVAWYKNPSWTSHIITTNARGAFSVFAIDLDKDGDTDVLSASGGDDKVAWYENDGSEHFTEHVITSSADGATDVFAIDINGDNEIDVLSTSSIGDEVVWYKNDGNEHFTEHVISAADNARAVFAADVDGDNRIDVLSASDNGVVWYKNNGGSTPTWTKYIITTPSNLAWDVFATDMDNDDDVDILSAFIKTSEAVWYENDGGSPPGWTKHFISSAFDTLYQIFATDLDNDGDVDALTGATGGYELVWHESNLSQAPPKPKLKVLAVPIKWTDQTEFEDRFKDMFNEVFLKDLPIYNCKDIAVEIEWIDVNKGFNTFHCSKNWRGKIGYDMDSFTDYLIKNKHNYNDHDLILGLVNRLEFKDTGCFKSDTELLTGTNNGEQGGNIAWAWSYNKYSLAHEIGHLFGLEDEYCSNPAGSEDKLCNDGNDPFYHEKFGEQDINYLSSDYGCNPLGGQGCCEMKDYNGDGEIDLCDDGYLVCCDGNIIDSSGKRSIMSHGGDDIERWRFGTLGLKHLSSKNKLKCD